MVLAFKCGNEVAFVYQQRDWKNDIGHNDWLNQHMHKLDFQLKLKIKNK